MADISNFLHQIRNASRGETVRDSITGSMKQMGENGVDAKTLNGRPPSYFIFLKDAQNAFLKGKIGRTNLYDNRPQKGSYKTVSSGGMYEVYRDMNDRFKDLLGDE